MSGDERTYIRVHDGMPDHPKVEGLSDKAFRLLVSTWCWCGRHLTDGHVRAAVWSKRGTAAARAELIAEGLAEVVDDGVIMHDFPFHQRTKAEVEQRRAVRKGAGAKGNHQRWHADRGLVDPDCPECIAPSSQRTSQTSSQVRSQPRRKASQRVEVEVDKPTPTGVGAPTLLPVPIDEPPTDQSAQTLIGEWIDHCNGARPPNRVIGQVSRELRNLLDEGIPPADVRAGLARWHDRRLNPSALASVVHEIRVGPGQSTRPSTTDQRVGAALAIAERLRSEEQA